ncbi:MAG TPA: universal stress protein [Vicinamibacterales bacterium]|jgi:nucleotide-binding universal stress UspA family protein|nr:universal stress protein [Vicinamibacterales bacterium]
MPECPRSIVVAVDFGRASARAVAAGGAIAERCGATLRLLHAEPFDAPVYFTAEQLDALRGDEPQNRERARVAVTQFGRQHTSYPFIAEVEDRAPVDAILHAAATADLVVMGTHGRRGASRWWLGSVAERVLRESPVPLLIEHANGSNAGSAEFRHVLVQAMPPLAGDATARYAETLARRFNGIVEDRRGVAPAIVADLFGTLVAVACPVPRTAAWLVAAGEPLVRGCTRPVLFVPESAGGEPV